MLQTKFITRGLLELSPRPWSLCFETHTITSFGGVTVATVPRHEDLDWLANAPELVEMLIHEIVRFQRLIRRPIRTASQLFARERRPHS